ncbi:MAG: ERF family protein [Acidobacteria bacterium]|nr:ERF family protein [Acidobacteriota bacterium]
MTNEIKKSSAPLTRPRAAVTVAAGAPLIYAAINAIMSEIPAIAKTNKNKDQGFIFRGIDDVYFAVNPVFAAHNVFMRAEVLDIKREERPSKSGGVLTFVQARVRYHFVTTDGSSLSTDSMGEGMDSADKATAKAMAIAHKYAIIQMFCIPTAEQKDPDFDNPEPAAARPTTPPASAPGPRLPGSDPRPAGPPPATRPSAALPSGSQAQASLPGSAPALPPAAVPPPAPPAQDLLISEATQTEISDLATAIIGEGKETEESLWLRIQNFCVFQFKGAPPNALADLTEREGNGVVYRLKMLAAAGPNKGGVR